MRWYEWLFLAFIILMGLYAAFLVVSMLSTLFDLFLQQLPRQYGVTF